MTDAERLVSAVSELSKIILSFVNRIVLAVDPVVARHPIEALMFLIIVVLLLRIDFLRKEIEKSKKETSKVKSAIETVNKVKF